LQEAHQHEKPLPISEEQISYPDVKVTEDFIRDHEELLLFSVHSLVQAALRTPGAIDADVMAALEALIQTQRTLESGLVYETRAENTIAMAVQRSFTASLADYEKVRRQREGLAGVGRSDLLSVFVFLHRLGQQNRNGRPRGRMYLDLLRQMVPDVGVEERAPSIIL
jgi:hypothetical protein